MNQCFLCTVDVYCVQNNMITKPAGSIIRDKIKRWTLVFSLFSVNVCNETTNRTQELTLLLLCKSLQLFSRRRYFSKIFFSTNLFCCKVISFYCHNSVLRQREVLLHLYCWWYSFENIKKAFLSRFYLVLTQHKKCCCIWFFSVGTSKLFYWSNFFYLAS